MMLSFWVVIMPGGDRPYLCAAPPPAVPRAEWEAKGGRVFQIDAELPLGQDLAIQGRARPCPSFEQAWKAKGYQYGEEALEQVRLGWELKEQSLASGPVR